MTVRDGVQVFIDGYTFGAALETLQTRIETVRRSGNFVEARIIFVVPDRYYPDETKEIHTPVNLDMRKAPEDWHKVIWCSMLWRLVHEVGEGFKHNGENVFDPHEMPRSWPWNQTWPWSGMGLFDEYPDGRE